MVAVGTEEGSLEAAFPLTDLREVGTDFAKDLGALFTVIVVEELSRGIAVKAPDMVRDTKFL